MVRAEKGSRRRPLPTLLTAPTCVRGFTSGDAALKAVSSGEAGSCAV